MHSQSAQVIPVALADVCQPEWKPLVVASEAYAANTGVYPADQFALVAAGMMRYTVDDFEYSNAGPDYVLTGVGDCAGFEPS